ncbi:GGDEF domain-containing protein [Lentibacillus sp. JNUCC-1]|uniref:GGDEF domain-containing protein n=1 Tax=Lentibacillus sp. JNUCC-1 TaxID=2654513 RepID=UPI001E28DA54|nr:GGDEF domain-containing protein [Lentibacillus sp. JNUCC-1]
MIIKDLFTNLAIIVAMLFLYTQFINKHPLNRQSAFREKVIAGFLGGLLGFVLMFFSMNIDTTIIDLRHIPVVLMSYYGGPVPALTAAFVIIAGRLLIGFNLSSVFGILFILLTTGFSIFIMKQHLAKKFKLLSIMTFSNIIFTSLVAILIKPTDLVIIIPAFWLISYLAGFIAFYVAEFLLNSHILYTKYMNEAKIDGLTGLNNHRSFDHTFNQLIEHANEKHPISLLYIDIDFFKQVNDTYGHSEGDLVLQELGMILARSVRSTDIVSRKGGEEFTIILTECPLAYAQDIAESIRQAVEAEPFLLSSGTKIYLTVSIGVATFPETTQNAYHLIEDADHALYNAKQTGRNKVSSIDTVHNTKETQR